MTTQFRKTSVIVATVALGCFGAGYASSGGTHVIQRTVAVNQTFAAARDVDNKRQDLERSLSHAQQAADLAAPVSDDALVKAAARSLSVAATDALVVASQNAVDVEAARLDPTPTPKFIARTLMPSATVVATQVEAATPKAELVDVVADQEVAHVLDGEVTDIASARDATDKLNEVGAALDDAQARVDAQTKDVREATDQATLVLRRQELDTATAQADPATASAATVLEAIGLRVTDAAVIDDAKAAASTLTESANLAKRVDRGDLTAVTVALERLTGSSASLQHEVDVASASYLTWLTGENSRRATVNEQLLADHADAVAQARVDYVAQNVEFASERSNGWTGNPAEVSGSNGRLAASSLCAVAFAPGHFLQCDAARTLADADAAYLAQTGSHLAMTDSYRSYWLQVVTRTKKPRTAAVPGNSNHGWGMAVDLDSASAAWLAKNGAEFGWVHPDWAKPGGSKPESWHLEYVAPEVGEFTVPEDPALLEMIDSALPQT